MKLLLPEIACARAVVEGRLSQQHADRIGRRLRREQALGKVHPVRRWRARL